MTHRIFSLLFLLLVGLSTAAQESKVYLIKWFKDQSKYISEEASGQLVVSHRDNSLRQFWRFVPVVGKSNVYYLQSTATQRYIQTTNRTASSQSKVATDVQPVEFYVAQNPQVQNAWSIVSTDVPNYNDPSSRPTGLNKDGASSNVICWYAANNNTGSYWLLEETENLYEVRPFGLGKQHRHLIVSGKTALQESSDGTLSWEPISHADEQVWHFLGENNAQGGYQIVNAKSGKAIERGKTFRVGEQLSTQEDGVSQYYFTLTNNARLQLVNQELFRFPVARSPIARDGRLYDQPCGKPFSAYVRQLSLEGDNVIAPLTYPEIGKAANSHYYTLFTRQQAQLLRGEKATLSIELTTSPHANTKVWVYFDWNADGIFEQSLSLTPGRRITEVIHVPETAKFAQSRMRLRFTINDLEEADDEVVGYVWDGMINVVPKPNKIKSIETTIPSAQNKVYDLGGRQLAAPSEGINIINGKTTILQ